MTKNSDTRQKKLLFNFEADLSYIIVHSTIYKSSGHKSILPWTLQLGYFPYNTEVRVCGQTSVKN